MQVNDADITPGQIKLPSQMRRQRTASESGEANGSENELNDPQRIRESSDNSVGEGSSDNMSDNNNSDADMEG